MTAIDKRVAALESKAPDKFPYVALAWGNHPPVVPPGANESNVLVIRRAIWEPAVRGADGNIIEPARPWADDDPRYLSFASRERAESSQLAIAAAGARDTLAIKLAALTKENAHDR